MTVPNIARAAHIAVSRLIRRLSARRADRAYAVENARPVIGHVQRALCLAGWGITAREYLAAIGCDDEFVARYESAFGRQVAKTYRANHDGAEPPRGARVVMRGRVWRVMSYRDEKDLYAGALAYRWTAELLAA